MENANRTNLEKKENLLKKLSKIQDVLENAMNLLLNSLDNEIVLVIGNTGAGKSTLINYLCGNKLKKIQKRRREFVIDLENSNGTNQAKIGHEMIAETLIPSIYKSSFKNYCDCPGFLDNRSLEDQLCASFCINNMIEKSKSISGMIITIDSKSIVNDRGSSIRKLFEILSNFMRDDTIMNSLLFVFTKTNENDSIEFIIEDLQEILESEKKYILTHPDDAERQGLVTFLEFIIANPNLCILGNVLDNGETREELEKKLQSLNIIINKESFNLKYNEHMKKLYEIINDISVDALACMKAVNTSKKEFTFLQENIFITEEKLLVYKESIPEYEKLYLNQEKSKDRDIKNLGKIINLLKEEIESMNKLIYEHTKNIKNSDEQINAIHNSDPVLVHNYYRGFFKSIDGYLNPHRLKMKYKGYKIFKIVITIHSGKIILVELTKNNELNSYKIEGIQDWINKINLDFDKGELKLQFKNGFTFIEIGIYTEPKDLPENVKTIKNLEESKINSEVSLEKLTKMVKTSQAKMDNCSLYYEKLKEGLTQTEKERDDKLIEINKEIMNLQQQLNYNKSFLKIEENNYRKKIDELNEYSNYIKKLKDLSKYISFESTIISSLLKEYELRDSIYVQDLPFEYLDPITLILMRNPVKTICGHIFDKTSFLKSILKFGKCPLCRKELLITQIEPCEKLRIEVEEILKNQIS